MSTWKFYHNPQCSKSREALKMLETLDVDFQIIDYRTNPLSVAELKELMGQLNVSVSALVRTKEIDFTNAPIDLTSDEAVAHLLAQKPHLMERPVLQGKGRATIGRPLENFAALLNLKQPF